MQYAPNARQSHLVTTGFYGIRRYESRAVLAAQQRFSLNHACCRFTGRVCKTQYTGSTPVGAFDASLGYQLRR
jgi:hypothetical protein